MFVSLNTGFLLQKILGGKTIGHFKNMLFFLLPFLLFFENSMGVTRFLFGGGGGSRKPGIVTFKVLFPWGKIVSNSGSYPQG